MIKALEIRFVPGLVRSRRLGCFAAGSNTLGHLRWCPLGSVRFLRGPLFLVTTVAWSCLRGRRTDGGIPTDSLAVDAIPIFPPKLVGKGTLLLRLLPRMVQVRLTASRARQKSQDDPRRLDEGPHRGRVNLAASIRRNQRRPAAPGCLGHAVGAGSASSQRPRALRPLQRLDG